MKRDVLPRRSDAEMGPPTCYALRRNTRTASILKDLVKFDVTVRRQYNDYLSFCLWSNELT